MRQWLKHMTKRAESHTPVAARKANQAAGTKLILRPNICDDILLDQAHAPCLFGQFSKKFLIERGWIRPKIWHYSVM